MLWRGIDSITAGRCGREASPWLIMKPRFKHRASGMLRRITQLAHAPHAPEEEYMGVQRMGAKVDYDLMRSEVTRFCSCGCAKRSAMRLPRRWISVSTSSEMVPLEGWRSGRRAPGPMHCVMPPIGSPLPLSASWEVSRFMANLTTANAVL
jgi:hypothetical protein